MQNFFDVNTTFFTAAGYSMSFIEFFGTVFNLVSVWLVTTGNILTWPIGLIGVILFASLFYQIRLYSDFFEQIYYLITGLWGWWLWKKTTRKSNFMVERLGQAQIIFYISLVIISTLFLWFFTSRLNLFLPAVFTQAASYPFLDSLTTVMSFVAQWLMARKKIESWLLWIIVDVIGIWLYYTKGVVFISLLYIIFLVLAYKGLINWIGLYQKQSLDNDLK